MHRNKKWSHFDLKSCVTGGTKVRPSRLRVIGEYLNELTLNIELNLLSISSQFDSNILQLLGISFPINSEYRVN